jgi:DNA invertase Pin-like site-specific DNA recombinase
MDPGVSGITLNRPQLQRLLTDCRAGKIGTVVTKDPDRLSRNPAQLITVLDVFRETGVQVQFATPGGWTDIAFLMLFLPALAEVDGRR